MIMDKLKLLNKWCIGRCMLMIMLAGSDMLQAWCLFDYKNNGRHLDKIAV